MRKIFLFIGFMALHLTACEQIAVMNTQSKKAEMSHTSMAIEAKRYFWKTLHAGRYQDIEKSDYLLTAAYLQNPHDPMLAAYIGFLHIWKISERARQAKPSPLITNEMILAEKYFADASALAPKNPIFLGFLGDTHLVESTIFDDKRQGVKGYFELKRAIHAWPQFNYFTAGYPMSNLPKDSEHFKEALTWQWQTLDLCAGKKVSRQNPDFSPYMKEETHEGPQRACWNSWIAPYNFEGFFMNMGDMVVKSGDWQTAIILYQNARLAKNYNSWPYRAELEKKIQHARQNVSYFQQDSTDKTMMFRSRYACVACHQQQR